MENLLQQGISAAKAGNKPRAFQLLKGATQDGTLAEQAWLWLSAVVDNDAERLFCLGNALRINPNNGAAQSKASELRQKGIFPSAPTPPSVSNPPMQIVAPQLVKPSQPVQKDLKPAQPEPLQNQPDLSEFYRFAALEFSKKQSPKAITKKLTDQGVTPAVATRIVSETEAIFNKARADKSKKRMRRGLIWAVIGIVLTCGTMALASSQGGGGYILFYGAIIYGAIDFLAGLIGWLWNS